MWPEIILRYHGSVLPYIWFEIVLTGVLGTLAWGLTIDSPICAPPADGEPSPCGHFALTVARSGGHQIVGVLLAFLVVFRSQIAWGMYIEGRSHWGTMSAGCKFLATEIVGSCAPGIKREGAPAANEDTAVSVMEIIRLLKLFIATVVEHVRSTDGHAAWAFAQEQVRALSMPVEYDQLIEGFGPAQEGNMRVHVEIPRWTGLDMSRAPEKKKEEIEEESKEKAKAAAGKGRIATRRRAKAKKTDYLDKNEITTEGERMLHREYSKKRLKVKKMKPNMRDPTSAKPLMVLTWLRWHIDQLVTQDGALEASQLSQISSTIRGMVQAYGGIDKVNTMVLPLPYEQLLKIFTLFYVFTLPFAIAPSIGPWTIPIAIIAAIGFFGLDSVGSEMESPFGTNDNDLPLFKMANMVYKDLDAILTTMHVARMKERYDLSAYDHNKREVRREREKRLSRMSSSSGSFHSGYEAIQNEIADNMNDLDKAMVTRHAAARHHLDWRPEASEPAASAPVASTDQNAIVAESIAKAVKQALDAHLKPATAPWWAPGTATARPLEA